MEVRVDEILCAQLQWTDLEEEEITIEPSLVEEVWSRGKKCLLVKLLSLKYSIERRTKLP